MVSVRWISGIGFTVIPGRDGARVFAGQDQNVILNGEHILPPYQIFIMRAILGVVFAVIIARTFYPQIEVIKVVGLGIILVGLAYFAEYLRTRKRR